MTFRETLVVMSLRPTLAYSQAADWRGDDVDVIINLQTPVPVGQDRIAPRGLHVRATPTLRGAVIATLQRGTIVERWGHTVDNAWHLIRSGAVMGWCSAKYLEVVEEGVTR